MNDRDQGSSLRIDRQPKGCLVRWIAARGLIATIMGIFVCSLGCGALRTDRRAQEKKNENRLDDWTALFASWKRERKERSPFPRPSLNRLWRPDLAILPFAEFSGNEVTIHHVRNCRYRTESDYDVRHYDLNFFLDQIKTVDFIIVPFKDAPALAHTMMSFGLSDGRYFVVSVEARLEQNEQYTPTGGSLRAFELMYVIGDERDLIPLRTEVRNVDVYLYPGNASPDQVQDLLVDVLHRVNRLAKEPEYYDTLTNNCTTNLVDHVNNLRPGTIRLDPRVLLPGHSDRLAYELGLLRIDGKFEEAKIRSKINLLSHLYHDDPLFSQRIRRQIP